MVIVIINIDLDLIADQYHRPIDFSTTYQWRCSFGVFAGPAASVCMAGLRYCDDHLST